MQMPIFKGVVKADPLEQPVCQRSTGYSEPGKRRAGAAANVRSQRGDPFRQLADQNAKNMRFSRGF
jgi:hypothetical protein